MLEPGRGGICCVGTVAENSPGIPNGTRIHRHVAGLLAEAHPVHDRFRPRLPIPEPRQVVIREYSENRRPKTNYAQNLCARGAEFLRVLLTDPVFVWEMHQQRHTSIDGGNHGFGTHCMDLDYYAGFLCLVHHRLENFQLFFGWPGNGSKGDLTRKLDSHLRHLAYFGTSRFRSVVVQPE